MYLIYFLLRYNKNKKYSRCKKTESVSWASVLKRETSLFELYSGGVLKCQML